MTGEALQLMAAKSADYANDDDAFTNFRQAAALGICSAELGVLIRMSDKLSRLAKIIGSGKVNVSSETLYDTAIDTINYSVIIAAMCDPNMRAAE